MDEKEKELLAKIEELEKANRGLRDLCLHYQEKAKNLEEKLETIKRLITYL
jgi:hypothetical protein